MNAGSPRHPVEAAGVPGSLVGDSEFVLGRLPVPLSFLLRPHTPDSVRLRGSLDHHKADRLRRRLSRALARNPATLEVDLSKVTYLSPECAAVFLTTARDARMASKRLVITHGTRQSLRVLRKLGLEQFLDVALPSDQ
ncbi:STAS domain-containing protein [Streptomyces seoulensis]|uniref:STAS domain-containing protein n=1 Tax=Streptomyces seoulensis TaxID=73044 RepID=UPI00205C5FE9|nr:hypothetical protein HEK131_45140 [Streptomyces seoulensis]